MHETLARYFLANQDNTDGLTNSSLHIEQILVSAGQARPFRRITLCFPVTLKRASVLRLQRSIDDSNVSPMRV